MKKLLLPCALAVFMLAGCSESTEKHETTTKTTTTETTISEEKADEADAITTKIEQSSEEVDSLVSDL